jgi:hypothetical protein
MIERLLLAALCCLLSLASADAQTRLGPLGPGLACNPTVYNPGTAPVIADCPLTSQVFYEAHTASCTINSTCGSTNDSGKLLTATAAAVTFTLAAPGAAGTAGYNFGYDGSHSYTLTSTANIYGCGATSTSVTLSYGASVTPDGTAWQCTPYGGTGGGASSFFPTAYLAGLIPSNDGTTPNTVIDISPGVAADDTNVLMMTLAAANFKKSIPGTVFAAGSGNSCQDVTGAMAALSWYYLYLISNASGSTVDILCSQAKPVLPWTGTFPSGYTLKRWIGEIATTAAPVIKSFQTLDGHLYTWTGAPGAAVYQTVTVGAARTLVTLDVPPGINVEPLCRVAMTGTPPASVMIYNPAVADGTPNTATPFNAAPGWDQAVSTLSGEVSNAVCPPGMLTNTAAQIAAYASAAGTTVNFISRGWRQ